MVSRAIKEKCGMCQMRVTGSRERDEFKADIVDLRLSLGVVEKRCERKIEEKMEGLERRVGVVEASRKRIEEGLRDERVFVENMCRETSEEVSRVAGKCEEMMKKEREEIVGEVHRGIGEMERRLGVAVRGGEEAVERVEERLGKVEKEVKSSRRRNSGGNRVVTITASPSRLDEPSSSEDSYDEMQRDIKYEHICSRLKKLESVLQRVYEVEEKLRQGQRQEVAMESAGVTREEVEELRRSVWKEVNLVREQLGEVAAEVRGESRKEGWADATGRARIEERVEEISKALQVMEFRVEELGRGSDGREFGGLRECVEEWVNRSEKLEAEVESLAGRQVEMGEEVKGMVRRMDGIEEGESRMGIVVERVEGEMAVLARAVAEVSDLRTSVDEISDFLSKFPRDGFKEDAQRSIEGLRSGLAEVRVEMEEVREVRHAMGRMGEVESRLGHVEANMEWVEGEFNAYKKEEVWEAEVSRNRETLERVEEELGLQKKQLEGIEPGLSANREALEGLTVTVGKLERRAMGAVAAVGPQEEGMEGSSGRRIRELEESVEELMALLGVVDDLAKNQTEMRKSLQSRYDRETAEMGAALRKEIGEVREAVAEGAVGVEELRRIVGKLEGRLRLDEEVVVDTVRGKQERLNGDDSARERLQVVGPDDGLWVERKELAAMKAQTRELQEAMDGSQERVEEWIESKLEVLQSELVERDSEWQKMVEEQVTEALGHIEGYVDPEIARLSSSLEGVAERLVNVEASVAEGMRMRREMEGMGKERRPLLSPYGVGEEARNVQLEDRLAACESALEETVGSAREVEGIRRELEKVSVMVARHEASITTTGSGRDQEARILEMQNAIQTVHSRMCRLASAIRELYSDCRTSLSTNFPEAADALLQGGLRIPEWTDESLMHSMSNRLDDVAVTPVKTGSNVLVSELGLDDGGNITIASMRGFTGGMNGGIWFVKVNGANKLCLKLVSAQRKCAQLPTEAGNYIDLARRFPFLLSRSTLGGLLAFPVKIFDVATSGTASRVLFNLIAMPVANGVRLAEILGRKVHAREDNSKVLEEVGRQLRRFHERINGASGPLEVQHTDFQPCNIFVDEPNLGVGENGGVTFVDLGGMGVSVKEGDYEHFVKSLTLLGRTYGQEFVRMSVKAFTEGYGVNAPRGQRRPSARSSSQVSLRHAPCNYIKVNAPGRVLSGTSTYRITRAGEDDDFSRF
ncbi:Paramyosin, putative [Perkinsus marinus ATCC 50983]|uniref:Paramyosin, putative n=1 Tax=Perkinsus marinus (strain ATCC 50983 / TXsc) TaxID=423536 RepID=C5KT39_PERM5|nr:Paramyosin, putative [Perkinsus marinus ATCC 50983]EER12389.1 Paramyosin, putative [Perkinsus marinus ATCC 50983]|eukprot:XP_002780594.1 Paramyosin, putative [Perkinsus marinus ATCC 50983]